MSKTHGNAIAPAEVITQPGAALLRLWVAAEDYRDDVRVSKEILAQQVEAYRRLRNTARFLLSNLFDFDPARHAVRYDDLPALERWALHRTHVLATRVRRAYDDYEFHVIYHALNNFCSVDLSAFYLDVRKDRLYCERADAPARRATQTALHAMLDVLVRLIAPITSFTADEVWQFMPGVADVPSVFLAGMPTVPDAWRDDALAERFEHLLALRGAVTKAIEDARHAGTLKQASEARVVLGADAAQMDGVDAADLAELCLVSEVVVDSSGGGTASPVVSGLRVGVERASGTKCPRCWIVRVPTGAATHPDLCGRCAGVLS
jgi:isoleucyl-tRNA synthetase